MSFFTINWRLHWKPEPIEIIITQPCHSALPFIGFLDIPRWQLHTIQLLSCSFLLQCIGICNLPAELLLEFLPKLRWNLSAQAQGILPDWSIFYSPCAGEAISDSLRGRLSKLNITGRQWFKWAIYWHLIGITLDLGRLWKTKLLFDLTGEWWRCKTSLGLYYCFVSI